MVTEFEEPHLMIGTFEKIPLKIINNRVDRVDGDLAEPYEELKPDYSSI